MKKLFICFGLIFVFCITLLCDAREKEEPVSTQGVEITNSIQSKGKEAKVVTKEYIKYKKEQLKTIKKNKKVKRLERKKLKKEKN